MADDENLSGYLDGELGPADRAKLAALISRDRKVGDTVRRLQDTDKLLREAFDEPMRAPIPDRLAATIEAGLANGAGRSADGESGGRERRAATNDNRRAWWTSAAVAASLAVGLVLGGQFRSIGVADAQLAGLSAALDSTPSLQTASLVSDREVTPSLTFARRGGGFCRQFAVRTGTTQHSGVACRDDGHWRLEAFVPTSEQEDVDNGYGVATSESPAAVDDVVSVLRDGDPLSGDAERSLIDRNWKR